MRSCHESPNERRKSISWVRKKHFCLPAPKITVSGHPSKIEASVEKSHGATERGIALSTEDKQMFVGFEIN